MLILSGTLDFTPFGELMISPIHYIHYILLNLSVLGLCLRINGSGLFAWISLINGSGLFAWISLTALFRLCLRFNGSGLFAWISLTACLDYVYGSMTLVCYPGLVWLLCLDYIYGLMTGLFAWISLTAWLLSRTYFITRFNTDAKLCLFSPEMQILIQIPSFIDFA